MNRKLFTVQPFGFDVQKLIQCIELRRLFKERKIQKSDTVHRFCIDVVFSAFQLIEIPRSVRNRTIGPVVFVHVITLNSNARARGRIAHFHGAVGFLIHPVQIGLGVRNFRLNLKNVCTDSMASFSATFAVTPLAEK